MSLVIHPGAMGRPLPTTMKAPGDRRPGIWREGVLQIWVTRACDLMCVGCTQGSNLGGKPGMMTPEQFEVACQSLQGYWGVVGMFGGNPCVHPQFEELCDILARHIPKEQRGIWTNNFRGHGPKIRNTFNPMVSNLNVHTSKEAWDEMRKAWPEASPYVKGYDPGKQHNGDSRHSPPWVAMQDVEDMTDDERWSLIGNCDVNQKWSALIGVFRGELRAWFCELAAAQAMLHAAEPDYPDTGMKVEPGWWQKPMSAFDTQVRFHCYGCGHPLRGAGDFAVHGKVEHTSRTHLSIFKPKDKGREVRVVTRKADLGDRVETATNYIENADLSIAAPVKSRAKRIDGILVCVGPVYAANLPRSLPILLDTLDTLTVVTKPGDPDVLEACANRPKNLRVVETDLFYRFGAPFNKGAALNVGFQQMQASDWVLHIDADMVPEKLWRKIAEPKLEVGNLYGDDRYYDSGRKIEDWPRCCGYFQLWSVLDPRSWVRPLYEPWWPHCGNYDRTFLDQWPEEKRLHLGVRLVHIGEPRSNWFGVGLEDKTVESQGRAEMERLHKVGLANARGLERLPVPDFKLRLNVEPGEPAWTRSILQLCEVADPFTVAARVGRLEDGEIRVRAGADPGLVRKIVDATLTR